LLCKDCEKEIFVLQFYFLSVLLNIIAGLVFLYGSKEDSLDSASSDFSGDIFSDDNNNGSDSDEKSSETNGTKNENGKKSRNLEIPFLEDSSFRLVLGILMVLTGLMKLLSPIQYDVPVVGDLIPSLAGIAGGISILLEWYKNKSTLALSLPEVLEKLFVDGRKYLGIFCIAAGVLHFIFPRVLFL